MLEFLKVQNPAQIKTLLKTYDPVQDTWIVSDLKSKQEIQAEAIRQYGYYTDDSILRISDFWKLWIRRLEPTLQVVSGEFIESLVQNFVDLYGDKIELIESEVSTLNKAVQEFAPILLHPGSEDILEEWLAQQETEKKWKRWYQLAKVCLNYIVYEKKAIDARWSAAYLQSLDLNLITWPRKIFVDLGSELTTVEMGLFKHISLNQDVVFITPDPAWKEKFQYLLNTYKENFGYGRVNEYESENSNVSLSPQQFIRLSTQLAEVKFAVAQIRKWLDSGVAVDKVAIISAEIEKYWPVLQMYLEEEGVHFKKETVSKLNSLGDVQNLLAALKSYSQDVSWDSLEKSIFSKEANLQYKYEKFKSLFYQLYDQDDLSRDTKIKDLFYQKIEFNSVITRDEFVSILVKIWISLPQSGQKNELFEFIFKDILAQSLNEKMRCKLWIQFLKNRLSQKEINLKKSEAKGIYVLPLMSAQMIDASHKIYIGLNDEFYHKKKNSLMALNDSLALKSQFDLAVDNFEESYLDFNLRWQALASTENTFFTTAHLSFASEPINASLFFVENSPQSEVIAPMNTRLDELQSQFSSGAFPLRVSGERLQQDLQGYSDKVISDIFKTLSVSDIENYSQCAFKLLASKGFRLRDLPQVAIDLDARSKGSLSHSLFEYCIQLIVQNEYADEKVVSFLEQKRVELNLYPEQDLHWGIQKNKFLNSAQKFYQFERERIKRFSVATEKSFEMYFNVETGEFSLQKTPGSFSFSMRIDRIDLHKENKYAIIFDYKSSAYQVSNHGVWITELQFQMLLYMIAADLADFPEFPVKAALYYQHKNFDIKKGLIDESIALNDFNFTKRNKSLISEDKLLELKQKFTESMLSLLKKLSDYQFDTQPADFEICDRCDWRKLCRAPHLM